MQVGNAKTGTPSAVSLGFSSPSQNCKDRYVRYLSEAKSWLTGPLPVQDCSSQTARKKYKKAAVVTEMKRSSVVPDLGSTCKF